MSYPAPAGLQCVDAETYPVLVLSGPITPDEASKLGDDVRALLETSQARVVVCDVGALRSVQIGTVDLLARLQLAARRAGGRIWLRDPSPALRALLDLVGLPFELEDPR